ncbi:MAG TPA: hypothetical protein VIH97_03445 [Candidatus Acidoferrales bacterium]|jgi:hypothetical protein
MSEDHVNEELVVAHVADNVTEAMVIRGLLQSAGIDSPGSVSSDPFPIPENPEGPHGTEIFVLESQVEEARKVIEEYTKSDAILEQESDESSEQS